MENRVLTLTLEEIRHQQPDSFTIQRALIRGSARCGLSPSKGDQAMTSLAKLRQILLTDPEVKAEYDHHAP